MTVGSGWELRSKNEGLGLFPVFLIMVNRGCTVTRSIAVNIYELDLYARLRSLVSRLPCDLPEPTFDIERKFPDCLI